MARSNLTRVLHLLILTLVLHQLIGSQFMQRPDPGDDPAWNFMLHEYAGLLLLAVAGVFWLWTMIRRGETRFSRLVPWFSVARLRDVWTDVAAQARRIASLRAPDDSDGALASAVHGLGLLVLTAMAATGTVFFFAQRTGIGHTALDLHRLMANLMWAYLVAHAGLAVLHHLLGSDIFARMFWVGRRRRRTGTAIGDAAD